MTAKAKRSRAVPGIPPHGLPTENVVVEIRADPKRPGGRLVLQDGVESSYVDLLDPTHIEFEYLRHLARVVDTVHPKRLPMAMAQIGGGPCVLARYLEATRRDLRALVIERDPEVIAIAREWLALETSARLEVRVADGRYAVAGLAPQSLDLLVVDAFDGVIVPHHLTTIELVEVAHAALRPGALHIVILIDVPPFGYATGIVATLRERYAHVGLLSDRATLEDEASGNLVAVASERELPLERLARLARLDPDPWDLLWGRRLDRLVAGAAPLADDVAPAHALAVLGPLWGRSRDARTGSGR